MAKAKKRATGKAGRKKTRARAAGRKPARPRGGEHEELVRRISEALGISVADAMLRALRELAERVAPQKPPRPDMAHVAAEKLHSTAELIHAEIEKAHVLAEEVHARVQEAKVKARGPASALPERLYLLLDGRGLDGRGMPVEVIDVPTVVGSERHCTVWVNSPRIETRHLRFAREDGDWYVEDLGSTHGTFLGDQKITRRRVEHGDEYRLAGYLRLRTEFR
jgi:FHA domain